MNQDEQQLHLLSIFYYVLAAFAGVFACIPVIHLVLGIVMVSGGFPESESGEPVPEFLGWVFIGVACFLILAGMTMAVLFIVLGRFIAARHHYMFCFIVAAISCLFMPFGTVLGIFTIIALSRPTVKAMFGQTVAQA